MRCWLMSLGQCEKAVDSSNVEFSLFLWLTYERLYYAVNHERSSMTKENLLRYHKQNYSATLQMIVWINNLHIVSLNSTGLRANVLCCCWRGFNLISNFQCSWLVAMALIMQISFHCVEGYWTQRQTSRKEELRMVKYNQNFDHKIWELKTAILLKIF